MHFVSNIHYLKHINLCVFEIVVTLEICSIKILNLFLWFDRGAFHHGISPKYGMGILIIDNF